MKRLLILVIITLSLLVANFSYAAQGEIGSPSDEQSYEEFTSFYIKKFLIGMNLGIGMSLLRKGTLQGSSLQEGLIKPAFTTEFAFRATYFFNKTFGLLFDLGTHILKTNETGPDGKYRKYSLNYVYLTVSPIVNIKNFYIFTGIYMSLIVKGEHDDNVSTTQSIDTYTIPQFGLHCGAGYRFDIDKHVGLLAGIELKYQFRNFNKESQYGSNIIAIYATVGVLLNLKPQQ